MKVRAEFYSRLREIAGASALEVNLPQGARVCDLASELLMSCPQLRDFEKSMLFGVGVEFVRPDHVLREGDAVAVMPPVQGG